MNDIAIKLTHCMRTESTGLPIKLKFAAGKGFYLTLPADKYKNGGALPEMFINMVKKKKQLCFSTIELVRLYYQCIHYQHISQKFTNYRTTSFKEMVEWKSHSQKCI